MAGLSSRDRSTALLVLAAFVALLAGGFSALVPVFWHEKFYIDGLTIIQSVPAFKPFGSSFNSAAFLLQPWISLCDALGGQVATYGTRYDQGLLITNAVFGMTILAIFFWFVLCFRPGITWMNTLAICAVMILLAPFYFCVTKELIAFLVSAVALLVWSKRPDRSSLGLGLYLALLVLLGVYFRVYYLVYALILYVNLVTMRRPMIMLTVYGVALIMMWVLFKRLPWDLLTKGRADYLEGVSASRIEYYLSDASFVGFIGNRMLAFLTMLLPVNLMLRSPAYTPFVLLQIWTSLRMFSLLKQKASGLVGFSAQAILAFTLVQALFEPDYGSYFRHRVDLLLFLLLVLARFPRIPETLDLIRFKKSPANSSMNMSASLACPRDTMRPLN